MILLKSFEIMSITNLRRFCSRKKPSGYNDNSEKMNFIEKDRQFSLFKYCGLGHVIFCLLIVFFVSHPAFCENKSIKKKPELFRSYIENQKIFNFNSFSKDKLEVVKKNPNLTPIEFKVNTIHPLEDEIRFNLDRLGKEISSIYKYNGFLITPKDLILADGLDDFDFLKEDVQGELKREARNYLKEKYLTKVVKFRDTLKMKLCLDSDSEMVDFREKTAVVQNPTKILHNIDSVVDRTVGVSPDLNYSIGLRLRSSPIFNGDLVDAIEPVLKVQYRTIEMRTKFKPASNIYEIELSGDVPLKITNHKLKYSISSENLRDADWNINYNVNEGNFFYLGGDIPFANFDSGGNKLNSSIGAGFFLTF
jgi:hypothetical protein